LSTGPSVALTAIKMIGRIRILLFCLLCFYSATAQESRNKKPKAFEVWVKLHNTPDIPKGMLFAVGDSSIILAGSAGDTVLRAYNISTIEMLKIRRSKSIIRGTIFGLTIGTVGGVVIANSIPGGLDFLTIPVSSAAGLGFGLLGAGIGILAGSVKDRIPIKHNYDNLNKYRGNLQDYSFQQEKAAVKHRFEHRWSAGACVGMSFAQDEFASDLPDEGYAGMVMSGLGLKINAGYRLTKIIGLNLSFFNNSFGVNNSDNTSSWDVTAVLVSPVISLPVSRKIRFDLAPGIGYAGTTLLEGEEFILNGEGFAMHVNGSLVFNYSKRWFASAGAGYFLSNLKYQEGGDGSARTLNIELGLAYKFGKKDF